MNATRFRDAYDGAGTMTDQWAAPDMSILTAGRSAPPEMPTALFGTVWPLIVDLAHGAGAPVDYAAASLLAVATSLIGGKRKIRPFQSSDWQEPCIIWIAVVGDPSSNKSPGMDSATVPLRLIERDYVQEHHAALQEHEAKDERARQERKVWEGQVKEATKAGDDTPKLPDAAVVPDRPVRRRLLVQDATPESMGELLSGNPFGTMLLRDELAGWLLSFDRYAPGGREQWLEAFGGRHFTIDRKSLAKPLDIPFNGVTVLGGIQPEKLTDCLLNGADDGLVPRFLWAWPDPIPFRRPSKIADTDRLERIYRRLNSVGCHPDPYSGAPVPVSLTLSAEAGDIFEAWMRDHQRDIGDAASLYKSFCGKLAGVTLRLALASEMLTWADSAEQREPTDVTTRSLAAAIDFVEAYAKPTAIRVFGDAALPPVERHAAGLARHILKDMITVLNQREARQKCGIGKLKQDAAAMDAAVAHLIEADWLRPAPNRAGSNPGRAKKDFEVNPLVFGDGA